MSERKIVVPEGMLKAVESEQREAGNWIRPRAALEAALRWLDDQLSKMEKKHDPCNWSASEPRFAHDRCDGYNAAIAEIRKLFLIAEQLPFERKEVFFTKPGEYYVRVPKSGGVPEVGPIESYVRRGPASSVDYFKFEPEREPEVPDEIRDLYFGGLHEGTEVTELVRTRVLEACHRGMGNCRQAQKETK